MLHLPLGLSSGVHLLEGLQGDENHRSRHESGVFFGEVEVEEHHLGQIQDDLLEVLGRGLAKIHFQLF